MFMAKKVETLDYYVEKALDFFEERGDYTLKLPKSSNTLVVGSQTGLLAGRILYRFAGKFFSHAKEVLARYEIDKKREILGSVTIVSASGTREVVEIADYALENGMQVDAIVCNDESKLNKNFKNHDNYNEILVEIPKKMQEPPTINTVTYGRMIQGIRPYNNAHENISVIRKAVKSLNEPKGGYGQFNAYTMILPDSMSEVAEMVDWKLRGEKIGRCVGTTSVYLTNFKHGAGVTDADGEVYVSVGLNEQEKKVFEQVLELVPDERKHHIDVPAGFGPLGYMMLGYAVVGQIQKNFPAFQKNIWDYDKRAKKW
jgi:hypothetical protein